MRDLRLRCIFIVLAAIALFSAPSLAQDDVRQKDVDTLKAKLFFVGRLATRYPDSGFADTWSYLEKDVSAALRRHGEAEELHSLRRDVLLSWGEHHRKTGNADLALEPYETLLAEYSIEDGGYREAAEAAAGIHMARAEAAETDEAKLAAYRSAVKYYKELGKTGELERIRGKVIDLQAREGIRLANDRKYGEAFDLLAALELAQGGSLGKSLAAETLDQLRRETGLLTVGLDRVNAPGTNVEEGKGFRLVLKSRKGGETTELAYSRKPFRWLLGAYDVELYLPEEKAPAVIAPVDLSASGGSVRFPGTFPAGMVYIPAGGDVERPFFIDRTEVTVKVYRAFESGYRPETTSRSDNHPAHGINFTQASSFARSVGKQLPTEAQWLWAAFAGRSMKYPWGERPGVGEDLSKHCHIGKPEGPDLVDSHADGASPFGVLNMAGNVWEWLRDQYAIGGGYQRGFLEHDVEGGWKADFLRDKKPDQALLVPPPGLKQGTKEFNDWVKKFGPLQSKYQGYRVGDSNLKEVGIRCVIEL